jgi:cystathionine beta-lyase/cystathionine gamma-synthase
MSTSLTKTSKNTYNYNRSSSIEYDELCSVVSSKYGNNGCIITPSGMSAIDLAITTAFINNKWKTINIVYSWEMYCDSISLIEYYKKIYPNIDIKLHEIVIRSRIDEDNKRIMNLFENELKDEVTIFFVESCSNMSGWSVDLDIIPKIRQLSKKLYFIVDNTWLTSVIFNPFKYDVDMVVMSMSKHYSGGQCISGAMICKDDEQYKISKDWYTMKGHHVSTHICSVILDNIHQMKNRLLKTSKIANDVVTYLISHPYVSAVEYPIHPSHSSVKKLKDKYFTLKHDDDDLLVGPDIFSFQINEKYDPLIIKLKNMDIINLKTSYGGPDTRIDGDPIETSFGGTWCRLSIGYDDDYEKIIKGLSKILDY